jgi:hypothetical protein
VGLNIKARNLQALRMQARPSDTCKQSLRKSRPWEPRVFATCTIPLNKSLRTIARPRTGLEGHLQASPSSLLQSMDR